MLHLFDEGLIYRGKRLVNWDPVLHTALSDLEVISEEEKGNSGTSGTREQMAAATLSWPQQGRKPCWAIRQSQSIPMTSATGTWSEWNWKLPLTGRTIPIIADEYVDAEFGSGCVKITPAHDFNDYEIGKRHDLPNDQRAGRRMHR